MRMILAVLVLSMSVAPVARADYVCSVSHLGGSGFGAGGAVSVMETAAPGCAGGTTGRLVCSSGATHAQCGKWISYSAAGLLATFAELGDAARTDQFVAFTTGQCASGVAANCVNGVTFFGGDD